MSVDLHCHSRISDGSMGIEELLATAKRRGVTALAVTDHDAVVGATRAILVGKRLGIQVIHGVELSAIDPVRHNKVHVLAYLCDYPDRLEGLCRNITLARREAANEMLRKVLRYYPIAPETVTRCAAGSTTVFKQHIMHALTEAGYADGIYGEVFQKLFSKENGIARVDIPYPNVNDVIDLIHSAGGLAVIAHPAYYHNEDLLEELVRDNRLDGVEVWHTEQTEEQQKQLEDFAVSHKLLATGGTDFHGMYSFTPRTLGNSNVPENTVSKMLNYKSRHKSK